jgi:mono/diheme cytochrome c family protein
MARNRTTKTVAQRIDLNYFKRATPFKRAKLWLAILAPAVALVWIGWHFLGGDQRVYSSGRLSEAHAVLEKQCAACHVPESGGFSRSAMPNIVGG